jgi:hypothetical protein
MESLPACRYPAAESLCTLLVNEPTPAIRQGTPGRPDIAPVPAAPLRSDPPPAGAGPA